MGPRRVNYVVAPGESRQLRTSGRPEPLRMQLVQRTATAVPLARSSSPTTLQKEQLQAPACTAITVAARPTQENKKNGTHPSVSNK